MSVYSIETTREEMKKEALRRMKWMEIYEEVINAFEEDDIVTVSYKAGEPQHNVLFLEGADGFMRELVRNVEEEYGVLVYHIIWNDTCFGEIWTLLFVSPTSSDWEYENYLLKDHWITYAYVDSEIESGVSEVKICPFEGGVLRTN